MYYEQGRKEIFAPKNYFDDVTLTAAAELGKSWSKLIIKVKFDLVRSHRKQYRKGITGGITKESVNAINVRLLDPNKKQEKSPFEAMPISCKETSSINDRLHTKPTFNKSDVTGSLTSYNRKSLTTKGYGFIKRSNIGPVFQSLRNLKNDNNEQSGCSSSSNSNTNATTGTSYLENSLHNIICQNEVYVNISELADDCVAALYEKNTFNSNGEVFVIFDMSKGSHQNAI